MAETIQAYFFGTSFGEKVNGKQVGLAGYAIPDLGVVFRSQYNGNLYECRYAGLLSLLKFIETNRKQLSGCEFEILSDSTLIIYQISHRKFITSGLAPYYTAALNYKSKVNFRVSWVPRQENVAIIGLSETPPLKIDLDLNLEITSPENSHSSDGLSP